MPVVACIGVGRDGRLFNVNADTFAGHLAARLGARRLVIAGTTRRRARRRRRDGRRCSTPAAIERLIGDGTATAGMIAKLRACEQALAARRRRRGDRRRPRRGGARSGRARARRRPNADADRDGRQTVNGDAMSTTVELEDFRERELMTTTVTRSTTFRRAKRGTCCRPTGASRSRSCAARASGCTTPRAASTSTCCRASASPRSATRTRGWRARSRSRRRR